MIHIRCHECGRKYNWAGDAFCPHCGAFNQAEDYSFDRERIVVALEEEDTPPLFGSTPSYGKRRKKVSFATKIIAISITIVWVVLVAVIAILLQVL